MSSFGRFGSGGILFSQVVENCKKELVALRQNELSKEIDESMFARVLRAVSETRKDLSRRPKIGGIYKKMLDELQAKHVLLWYLPRRSEASTDDLQEQQHIGSRKNMHSVSCSTSVFGNARSAALVRSRIRVYIPRFLVALLNLEDCGATRLYLKRPELFLTFENFFVMPNPAYFDFDAFAHDPKRAALDCKVRAGFGLVCWWIHPELRKRSRLFMHKDHQKIIKSNARTPIPPAVVPPPFLRRRRQGSPKNSTTTVQQIPDASKDRSFAIAVNDVLNLAADAVPYLYDVSDLTSSHGPQLACLADALRRHISQVYGIYDLSPRDLYFHRQHALWSAPDRAWALTLHLHIAIHRARTPACFCHSICLDDVITFLKDPQNGRALVAGTHPSSSSAGSVTAAPVKEIPSRRPNFDSDDYGSASDVSPRRIHHFFSKHTRQEFSFHGHFELLNIPSDPDQQRQAITLLQNAGFLVSEPLSPADLAFDELLDYAPAPHKKHIPPPPSSSKITSPSSVLKPFSLLPVSS